MPRTSAGRGKALLGSQTPTHEHHPDYDYSLGEQAIDFADMLGLELDPWQKQLLIHGLAKVEAADSDADRWAAFEVVIEIARQNGKSVVLYVVALFGLYVLRLKKVVYSAHRGETAMDAYNEITMLIKGCPALRAETPDRCFKNANGKEAIKLPNGQTLSFKTRTAGGGRGLKGDLVIVDEVQDAQDNHMAALFPTMRAQRDPQIWYAGSAGDQKSTVLGRLVRRIAAKDPSLVGVRFAGDETDDPGDPKTWAKTNPALGRRITVAHMGKEFRSMPPDKFARELLCIGDYPREDGEDWVIPSSAVDATTDAKAAPLGPVVFTADAKPDQSWAAIAAAAQAGRETDDGRIVRHPKGGIFGMVVDHQRGVRWLPARIRQLMDEHENIGVLVIDPKGPLARMVPDFEELGIKIRFVTGPQEVADACAWVYDNSVNEPRGLWHRAAPILVSAIASASTRDLSGSFAWKRTGQADISPFCAFTTAVHAAATWATKPPAPPPSPMKVSDRQQREAPSRRPRQRRRPDLNLTTASF